MKVTEHIPQVLKEHVNPGTRLRMLDLLAGDEPIVVQVISLQDALKQKIWSYQAVRDMNNMVGYADFLFIGLRPSGSLRFFWERDYKTNATIPTREFDIIGILIE